VKSRAFPAAVSLALLLAAAAVFLPHFLEFDVHGGRLHGALADILQRGAPLALLALGLTPVIATGGVDLSVGSVMALASSCAAVAVARGGSGAAAAAGIALGVGLAAGLANGLLVTRARIQPIVATLVLLTAGRGLAVLVSGGGILAFESEGLEELGRGAFAGFPSAGLPALAITVATAALVRGTTLGLHIEAIGDNERAARLSGLRVDRVRLAAYAFSGLCAGAAGLLVAADVGAADASHVGLYQELDAILAVVIGGTSLAGGRTSLAGSWCGALAIQALSTIFLFLGLGTPIALCVKAAAVLAAVAGAKLWTRRAEATA